MLDLWNKKPQTVERYTVLMADLRYLLDGHDARNATHPVPRKAADLPKKEKAFHDMYLEQDKQLFGELTDKLDSKHWVMELKGVLYYHNYVTPEQLEQFDESGLSLLHCILSKYQEAAKSERQPRKRQSTSYFTPYKNLQR